MTEIAIAAVTFNVLIVVFHIGWIMRMRRNIRRLEGRD
jgi:hypothetical protein